ncbi:ribonuclease P protein component [Pontiella sp.]|uniref:ribonuclease P protein component n=1 Tax=Pontiella sp. TaxID=2837462 RepID=UPI0035643895
MPKPHQRESDSSIDASPPQSGLDRCLSRQQRLTRSSLFSETFSQNRKWVGRFMVLWLRTGEGAALRLGVVTSKKVHLRANRRNFARRRLREAYRNLRPYFSGEFDVIFVGRRSILTAEWKDVLREMLKLAQRAGIISAENLERAQQDLSLRTP